MISRTFTVHKEQDVDGYKGFNRDFAASKLDLIAVVLVESEVEVFALDDTKEARTEFVRFISEQEEYQFATIAGIYHRGN